jgi:hypothetical protein
MRVRALRELPSNGKIAFGPLLFACDERGVLDPQPTDLQVSSMKLDGYLKWVEIEGAEPAKVEPIAFNLDSKASHPFAVANNEPKTPNLVKPVEDEDDVFLDVEPPKVVPAPKPKNEDYSKLSLAELKDLCDAFDIKYASNTTKAKLVELLKGV